MSMQVSACGPPSPPHPPSRLSTGQVTSEPSTGPQESTPRQYSQLKLFEGTLQARGPTELSAAASRAASLAAVASWLTPFVPPSLVPPSSDCSKFAEPPHAVTSVTHPRRASCLMQVRAATSRSSSRNVASLRLGLGATKEKAHAQREQGARDVQDGRSSGPGAEAVEGRARVETHVARQRARDRKGRGGRHGKEREARGGGRCERQRASGVRAKPAEPPLDAGTDAERCPASLPRGVERGAQRPYRGLDVPERVVRGIRRGLHRRAPARGVDGAARGRPRARRRGHSPARRPGSRPRRRTRRAAARAREASPVASRAPREPGALPEAKAALAPSVSPPRAPTVPNRPSRWRARAGARQRRCRGGRRRATGSRFRLRTRASRRSRRHRTDDVQHDVDLVVG